MSRFGDDGIEEGRTIAESGCHGQEAAIWFLSSEEAMEKGSDRKNIRTLVDDPCVDHLGSRISRSAIDGLAILRSLSNPPGEAKIANLGRAVLGEKDISGLDVAVKNTPLVGIGKTPADGAYDLAGALWGDEFVMASIVKGAASHKFHDEEEHSTDFSEVVYPNQSGMVQARHGFGLRAEGLMEAFVGTKLARQNFDGH